MLGKVVRPRFPANVCLGSVIVSPQSPAIVYVRVQNCVPPALTNNNSKVFSSKLDWRAKRVLGKVVSPRSPANVGLGSVIVSPQSPANVDVRVQNCVPSVPGERRR